MSDIAISVSNVSKCYRVFDNQRSRLLHAVWPAHTKGMQEVWALKDINFEINRGESVAIIGRNGGGKSTLLEILTGTLTPTTGSVKVNGRVSALLELGSGFNPEYSGRDNVILNGLLLGLSKEDILSRFSEIEAFAEIGAAIDRPVKTYSSGMMMRLAFAVQVLCDPDILIIDEALSVGDFFFQQKCLGLIRELCAKGVTILFVSHDMGIVRDICDRAIYLSNGKIVFQGDVLSAISKFTLPHESAGVLAASFDNSPLRADPLRAFGLPEVTNWQRLQLDGMPLIAVSVQNASGESVNHVKMGQLLKVRVYFQPNIHPLGCIALFIKNRFDQIVFVTTSSRLGFKSCFDKDKRYSVFDFDLDCMLEAGRYSMRVTFFYHVKPNQGKELDGTSWFGPIQVDWDYETEMAPFLGQFGLPVRGFLRHQQQEGIE
jgi:lipopolysaccharide transport system ATP-binding protein